MDSERQQGRCPRRCRPDKLTPGADPSAGGTRDPSAFSACPASGFRGQRRSQAPWDAASVAHVAVHPQEDHLTSGSTRR